MIYLRRYTRTAPGYLEIDLEVVEHEDGAARFEAQGYERITLDSFRATWRIRDAQRARELMPKAALLARAVGTY